MEELEPKHKDLIDKAFKQLGSEGQPYERRTTNLSFGTTEGLRSAFIECFTRYDKSIPENGFKWLPEYDKVIEWLVDNKGKGLYLCGACGRGKSNIILGVLKPLFIATGKPLPGFHASLLPSKSAMYDGWNYERYRAWKWSYIDELGAEALVNNYGERYESFTEIINKAEQELDILIISSNLPSEQFLQRYGD